MSMQSLTFRIDEELLEELNNYCEKINLKRGEFLRRLIKKEIDSSKIRLISKDDIKQYLEAAFMDLHEEILQINFEKKNLITKVGVNTTKSYDYELTNNNHAIVIKNNIGAIVKVISL